MYYYDTETIIPKYALEPDAETGNSLFRINKVDCAMSSVMQADFLAPHRKDYYFMAFVKQGSSRHWIDMTPYTLKPDAFYFTVPHQVHLKEESEPISGYIIGFTEEFFEAITHHPKPLQRARAEFECTRCSVCGRYAG